VIVCGSLIIVVSMFGLLGALRDNIKLLYVVSVVSCMHAHVLGWIRRGKECNLPGQPLNP
jgi:hypothetical protein